MPAKVEGKIGFGFGERFYDPSKPQRASRIRYAAKCLPMADVHTDMAARAHAQGLRSLQLACAAASSVGKLPWAMPAMTVRTTAAACLWLLCFWQAG